MKSNILIAIIILSLIAASSTMVIFGHPWFALLFFVGATGVGVERRTNVPEKSNEE